MTHYQKLVTLIFRVIGTIIIAIGVLMIIFAFGAAMLIDRRTGIAIGTIYGPPCLILGGAFWGLSKKIAGWICHDFDGPEKVEVAGSRESDA